MTHQELVRADFNAKAGVIEAERSYIRSQIALLEAQLKQNEVKRSELEMGWNNYQEGLKRAEEQAQVASNGNAEAPQPDPAPKTQKTNAAKS